MPVFNHCVSSLFVCTADVTISTRTTHLSSVVQSISRWVQRKVLNMKCAFIDAPLKLWRENNWQRQIWREIEMMNRTSF